MPRPRIAIVVTFFGRAPFWLPAFLVSCRANPDVQWIIYTDVDMGAHVPPNVAIKATTVADLNRRCTDALETRIDIQRRKLCDLKPTYGVVFEDDLRPFEFWACSDLDIVWGNVRHFATDDILATHDVFSSRPNKLSGHFTLFRNAPVTNRLFELIPDVRMAMSTTHYEHLDETQLTRSLKVAVDQGGLDPVPRVYWQKELSTNAEYQRAMGDGSDDCLWWRDGRTFGVHGEELMYVHFHKLKQDMATINFGVEDVPRAFQINRRGFFA